MQKASAQTRSVLESVANSACALPREDAEHKESDGHDYPDEHWLDRNGPRKPGIHGALTNPWQGSNPDSSNYSTMKTKLSILFTFAVLAALISGCGGGAGYPTQGELDSAAPPTATDATGDTGAAADSSSGKPGKPPKVTGKYGSKPKIATPKGDPPEKLIVKDLKVGTGKEAKDGDQVTVNYLGINWGDGSEFDTSFGKDPFKFALGTGAVIPGWDKGVKGMKVGGRRLLVIPPDDGYGASGQGSSIPPNSTLVFVVDLLKVSKG
jgi:peptidylprolyl isomerase